MLDHGRYRRARHRQVRQPLRTPGGADGLVSDL